MKLLVVSSFNYSRVGGIEKFCREIEPLLQKKGFEITNWFAEDREETTFALAGRMPLPRMSWFFGERSLARLAKNNDKVLVHSHLFFSSLLACLFVPRKKLLLLDHSSGFVKSKSWIITWLIKMWERFALQLILNRRIPVASVSNAGKEWLESKGLSPIGVVRNSINLRSRTSVNFPLDKDRNLIVFASRLVPGKGLDRAIQYWEEARERRPDLKLCVIGDGPEARLITPELEQQGLVFLGAVNPNTVLETFRKGMIFLFPSSYPEGLPSVVLESCAEGCIPILSGFAAAKEVIPGNRYGYICDSDEEFVSSILSALELSDTEITERASLLRTHLQENFSWDLAAKDLEEFLK